MHIQLHAHAHQAFTSVDSLLTCLFSKLMMKQVMCFFSPSVPTPIVQAMLIELLKVAAPDLIDCIHSPDLEDRPMSDNALFAVHLFHRW